MHMVYFQGGLCYRGIPAWNQGAARSSPSSVRLLRLSVRSGSGGGVGVDPWVLPSACGCSGQDPELQELICEIRFDLKSWSVDAGELWDNLIYGGVWNALVRYVSNELQSV